MSPNPPAVPPPDVPARADRDFGEAGAGIGGAPSAGPGPIGGGVADRTAGGASPPGDASTLFDALAGAPLKVSTVRLKGLHRTRRSVVERELENLGTARTVGDVRELLLTDWAVLAGLGAFSTVELAMEECDPVRRGRGEERERVRCRVRPPALSPPSGGRVESESERAAARARARPKHPHAPPPARAPAPPAPSSP